MRTPRDTAADDVFFRHQWRSFYAGRRRRLLRLVQLALPALACLALARLTSTTPRADLAFGLAALLLVLAGADAFRLLWWTADLRCPRCTRPFFRRGLQQHLLARFCLHCHLHRPSPAQLR